MGIDPPFLYERPAGSRWDAQLDRGFNPRAASEAAWAKEKKRKELQMIPKPEGPLIDPKEINRHPDSYLVVPSGYLDFTPISRGTKKTIIWLRMMQLVLRALSAIGSLGMLVLLVIIEPSGDGSDWIIRIPPAILALHSLYGIYHLSRRPGGRTAPSTASYFIFSCIFDTSFVPFMLFSAWTVRAQWIFSNANPSSDDVWKIMVASNDPTIRGMLLFATWIDSVTLAGISLACLAMCIYLAYQFRKIAALPPDMNPFEENLTRRSSKRHKKTKSTVSELSTASAKETGSARDSTLSLIEEKPQQRPGVPWMHTRNDSTNSLQSNSAPNSPIKSRPDSGISMMSMTPPANRLGQLHVVNGSATSLLSNPKRRQGHARSDSTGAILPPKPNQLNQSPQSPLRQSAAPPRKELWTAAELPKRQEEDSGKLRVPARDANASPGAASSVYSDAESWYTDVPAEPMENANRKLEQQQRNGGGMKGNWPLNSLTRAAPEKGENNWFAIGEVSDDSEDDTDAMMTARSGEDMPEFVHLRNAPSHIASSGPPRDTKYDFSNRSPRPLEMHPPTPPGGQSQQKQQARQVQSLASQLQQQRTSYPQRQPPQQQQQQQRMSYPQQHQPGSAFANREARRNRQALQPASNGTPNRGNAPMPAPMPDLEGTSAVMRKGDWVDDDGGHSAFFTHNPSFSPSRSGEAERLVRGGGARQQRQSLTPGRRQHGERIISSGYEDERKTLSLRNSTVTNRQVSGKAAEEGRVGGGGGAVGEGAGTWGLGSSMNALRSQMGW